MKIWTISELSHAVNKSAGTIRNYADGGLLKAIRLADGTRVFADADVKKFLENREVVSGGKKAKRDR